MLPVIIFIAKGILLSLYSPFPQSTSCDMATLWHAAWLLVMRYIQSVIIQSQTTPKWYMRPANLHSLLNSEHSYHIYNMYCIFLSMEKT